MWEKTIDWKFKNQLRKTKTMSTGKEEKIITFT